MSRALLSSGRVNLTLRGLLFMRSAAGLLIATVLLGSAALTGGGAFAANEAGDVTKRGAQPEVPAVQPLPEPDGSAEAVFRDSDMFGSWARDCGGPASLANPHVSVTTPSAGLVLENDDVGPDYAPNRYSVLSARRLPGTWIEVKVIFRPGAAGEERQTLVFDVHDGTRRTIFNRVDGGEVRVRDGVVLPSKIKTPVLRKCG